MPTVEGGGRVELAQQLADEVHRAGCQHRPAALARPPSGLIQRQPWPGLAHGAIEIRFRSGPVFVDCGYRVTGEVTALSQTPKTEVLWFDSRARDGSGTVVAEMRMMLRQMKQSSPLYQD